MQASELSTRIQAATQRISLGDCGQVSLVLLRGLPTEEEIADLAEAWLLPEEKERASRFVIARDRLRFRWRRLILRAVLSTFLDIDPLSIRYAVGRWGKPKVDLPGGATRGSWWNLSDSDDAVLVGMSETGLVGVDIERHREIRGLTSLAESIMHPREWTTWSRFSEEEQASAFFHLWSTKEAVVKSVGYGLSCPPKGLDVGVFSPAFTVSRLHLRGPDLRHWRVEARALDVDAEFSVAVAGAVTSLG